jgi:hypothetical protein
MFKKKLNKKSQVWTIEYILSFIVFIAIILLSVKMIFGVYANDALQNLQKESEFVSQYMLSEGYPDNWDNDTLIRVGLTTNDRLNDTKLLSFYSLNYSRTKDLMGIKSNYFAYFSNSSGIISIFHILNSSISESDGCGYGYYAVVKQYASQCEIDISSLKYDDMVKISRITAFNGSIIQLNIILWK